MTVLPLVIAPDPRLAVCSEPVHEVTDGLRKFMDDMVETMHTCEGIGLAAVQVGVHKRILVMDLSESHKRYENAGEKIGDVDLSKPIYMVNPEIIEESEEENIYEEGCLSFPEQRALVTRPKVVKVKYLDYNGKEQIMECDELLATCVQHEIDHLNGVVFIDHVSKMKRDFIMRKVKKVKKLIINNDS
ncbi:MAG: peptide deformylase [Alphaproteobacteria bacterium CG11_big_fil_rev_8_21_14_0_20_39_49]|nr:MAG: peptide deformylase [Alphaproteobacteria bacterium CG11_big_fil_rev_8_21_14_0_20_39_49]